MPIDLLDKIVKQSTLAKVSRTQIVIDFLVEGTEGVGVAQAGDLNLHGLYFNTLTIIPKGTKLQLRLPITESKEWVRVDAEVVYSQPRVGCAVEFIDLCEEAKSALTTYIQRQLKQAEAPQVDFGSFGQQPDPLRRREYQWIREHQDEYAGHYVVVEGNRLIAHGLDGRKVLMEAQKAGIKLPFLVHIDPLDEPPFGGW